MNPISPIDLAGFKLAESARRAHERLEQARPIKQLGAAALSLLMAGTLSLARPRPEEAPRPATVAAVAVSDLEKVNLPSPPTETVMAVEAPEAPPLPQWPETPGIEPQVEINLKAVKLSREGYTSFLQNLSMAYMPYAQQYQEFHHQSKFPREMPLPSLHVVNHYTAAYYNEVNGESVTGFIDAVAQRSGRLGVNDNDQCCATTIYIDRNSRSYLLTPPHFRVKSNPPHDHLAMPVDVEASEQKTVTTDQYTHMIYANIFLLSVSGLNSSAPYEQTVIGHAEDRSALLAANPELRCDPPDKKGCHPAKIDFKKPEMTLQRFILAEFVKANPDIWQLPLPDALKPPVAK